MAIRVNEFELYQALQVTRERIENLKKNLQISENQNDELRQKNNKLENEINFFKKSSFNDNLREIKVSKIGEK